MEKKITKRAIASMEKPVRGQAWLHDSELKGFMVLCQSSGRMTYVARYKLAGKWMKTTIASVAELDPEDAREQARVIINGARRGEDPKRQQPSEQPTVADLAERFMREHAVKLKPRTCSNYQILWDKHIIPKIGGMLVADVRRIHVQRVHGDMSTTPHNANRTLKAISKGMNLAEIWGWREEGTNPCRHVKAYPEHHRERTLDERELAKLWPLLESEKSRQDVPAAQLIQLLLLTGCRLNEWKTAQWEWLDLDRRVLLLPDTKTGARVIHLSDAALRVLSTLPRSGKLVLPGRRGTPISGIQKIWQRIRKQAGIADVRLHDLRHTVGSLGHRAGLTQRQIADLLGHRQLSTTARYINSADEHKRETAAKWGDVVTGITGEKPKLRVV